jgi:hypothetical protein
MVKLVQRSILLRDVECRNLAITPNYFAGIEFATKFKRRPFQAALFRIVSCEAVIRRS